MAEERNIRIEDSDGNIYYPNTKASNVKTSDGKNVETKLTEVFQSGLDGKNLLETSIKSKGGRVSKQGTVATFNELDLGIKSIETDNTGDATAVAGDILSGKTAYVKGKKLIGSMANRGAIDNTITTQGGQITIPAGYHNGSGKVKAQFPNLLASNIKKGINIGGVVGDYEGDGPFVKEGIEYVEMDPNFINFFRVPIRASNKVKLVNVTLSEEGARPYEIARYVQMFDNGTYVAYLKEPYYRYEVRGVSIDSYNRVRIEFLNSQEKETVLKVEYTIIC